MAKLFDAKDGDYIQLEGGKIIFHKNEMHFEADPSWNDPTGTSYLGSDGCKQSWKGADGREKVLVQMRRNPKNDGEVYVGVLSEKRFNELTAKGDTNALDHAMLEVFTINPDGAEFRVPVKMSAGGGVVGGPAPTTQFPNKLVSPDGHLELDIQNADAPGAVLYQDGVAIGMLPLFKK